jgi:hypothetical protein
VASPIDDSMDADALMDAIAWIAPALEITFFSSASKPTVNLHTKGAAIADKTNMEHF